MYSLMNKYFAGTMNDAEKPVLFRELDRNAALKDEFARLQNLMALSVMLHKENDEQWATGKLHVLMRTSFRRAMHRASHSISRYVAVAIVVSCVWILTVPSLVKGTSGGHTYIEVPIGQTVHITLPDGTEAWLSSRTKLHIPSRFNEKERAIDLNGEALFMVSENKEKPFTVRTKQYDIRVTGTRFNVFAYAESPLFRADLIEGSVLVYNKDEAQKAVCLNPQETVSLQEDRLVKTASAFNHSRYTMNGMYYFENTPFKEIIDCLELWYNVKIHIRRADVGACVFSGKFRQSDKIELILQAIKETGKFGYKLISENEIAIY
jgi:ferric-dicitrate binding protein FerR (iron transport regulator)